MVGIFNLDNMMVYQFLSDVISGTTRYAWIQSQNRSQNGRAALLSMVGHYSYEAGGQHEKRMSATLATIKSLHYKNKSVFSFEDFSQKMLQVYQVVQDTDEKMTEFNA